MTPLRALRDRLFPFVAGLLVTVGTSACDASSDPTGLVVTEGTHPALQLAAELPSLPGLAAESRSEDRVAGSIDLWITSWSAAPDVGEGRRASANVAAAAPLADRLGRAGVAAAVERLEAVLLSTDGLVPANLPEPLSRQLVAARRDAGVARRALGQGALSESLAATLHGADLLREVGPEGVARVLIGRAESGLASAAMPRVDPGASERGERLLVGARAALDDGDVPLALQRAYYACQLLGVPIES